jgi:murein L,D-transpeptidase YafK
MTTTQVPPPHSRSRFVPRLVAAGVLIIFVIGLIIAIQGLPGGSGDAQLDAINRTRLINRAQATLGRSLVGTPDPATFESRLASHGLALGAPILIRIFKREFELELWMARDGRYHKFATYPICVWSGTLGPKLATGDKQAPEGFYTVAAAQLNPNSRWHRSFNLGFPNAFDSSRGRTGSALMVHGGCSSVGCFAMTNPVIDEIWKLTTSALGSGQQKRFQVQSYPFRLTDDNIAALVQSPHIEFWRQLKQGYDLFDASQLPPVASVCRGQYQFKVGRTLEASTTTIGCYQGVSTSTTAPKKSL